LGLELLGGGRKEKKKEKKGYKPENHRIPVNPHNRFDRILPA